MAKIFAVHGDICYSVAPNQLKCVENGWLVSENGVSLGVYEELPERYQGIRVVDYRGQLVIPGLTDLHVHAPQYSYRALGMDLELIEWLNQNTFPEEAKYIDLEYAQKAYTMFTEDLSKSATARACIFATLHGDATELLMDLMDTTGIKAMVGKVNMDRNCPEDLIEEDAESADKQTRRWLDRTLGKYKNVTPILTPRFIPTCTDSLMTRLARIQQEFQLPLQSHMSENKDEVEWVRSLCPNAKSYGAAYHQFGLFGGTCKTIMAHCVYPTEEDLRLMEEQKVYVAHCPQSNINLSSGIAPVRTFLERGIPSGLGSDVAGGFSTSIFRAMSDTVQMSKMRWRLIDNTQKPLTIEEAFYLGTKGGGAFFGKAGSFEEGYQADMVILNDENLPHPQELTVKERLERIIYLGDDRNITAKYAAGEC